MRLINDWQYKYIEKCLYNYHTTSLSTITNDTLMMNAIDRSVQYFNDEPHLEILEEFYFKANHVVISRRRVFFSTVCRDKLGISEQNGYTLRREIIYRIAMNCYALGLFNL